MIVASSTSSHNNLDPTHFKYFNDLYKKINKYREKKRRDERKKIKYRFINRKFFHLFKKIKN